MKLFFWLFSSRLTRLTREASGFGRITLQQMDLPEGVGWHCSIRPNQTVVKKPRYAWTGSGMTMAEAIGAAIESAKEAPEMKTIKGGAFPQLGAHEE